MLTDYIPEIWGQTGRVGVKSWIFYPFSPILVNWPSFDRRTDRQNSHRYTPSAFHASR